MSTFGVIVYPIRIEPHPNADLLECAVVGEYRSIVRKGEFRDGDLVAYIPEGSLVPQEILRELGLEGKLAGPEHNRVKAIKLRGTLSQGICYPARPHWKASDDVAQELGITKYVPPVPVHMAGEVEYLGSGFIQGYDVEPYKKYPDLLDEGEPVVITEKVHGTCCICGAFPEPVETSAGPRQVFVTSKGMAASGRAFKAGEANQRNLYVRANAKYGLTDKALNLARRYRAPVALYGEVYGKGVQDLHYGAQEPRYALFDIYVGKPGQGRFLDHADLMALAGDIGLLTVRVLYEGPFSREKLYELAEGKESYSGQALHVREGVVVRPVHEAIRRTRATGIETFQRAVLKHVGEGYLLRKGQTTEFE